MASGKGTVRHPRGTSSALGTRKELGKEVVDSLGQGRFAALGLGPDRVELHKTT